jgi:hypothetical protein
MKMDKIVSCWNLIEQGRYEEACIRADIEYEETKTMLPLRNKVFALLHLKKYKEVINLCKFLIEERNGETDSDFIFLGIAYWIENEITNAIEIWRKGLESKYKDAAGGIEIPSLMYFASISLKDKLLEREAVTLLEKRSKSNQVINWPGPIASFLLDIIDEEELLSSVVSHPSLRAKQLCQAYFYIALKKLKNDNIIDYKEYLKKSLSLDVSSYLKQEYYLAEVELQK